MACNPVNTVMHSANTVRPESERPSCGRSLGDDERAVVEGVEACENLHQRGFAGAVRAHQADAVVGRDQPVGVFKKKFVAETFSGAGELNHGLESSSHKTAVPST